MTPRLSGQELALIRKQREAERQQQRAEEERRRELQRAEEERERKQREAELRCQKEEEERTRQEQAKRIRQQQEAYGLLRTVQDALYTEIDKLNKKAPRERISDYAVRKINAHIDNVKAFLPGDPYLAEVVPFVPAGDNPEYRDVALVLAELGAALQRFRKSRPLNWSPFM